MPPSHLVLPSIVLAASTLGLITRTTRAAMLEALSQDYIRVARAKGLARRAIMLGHALPNALLPVVTLGGLAYAQLLTGTVLTESIFSWPGLGRYTFQSAVRLDFPGHHGHHTRGRGDLRAWSTCWSICPTRRSIRACRGDERRRSRAARRDHGGRQRRADDGVGCGATAWLRSAAW